MSNIVDESVWENENEIELVISDKDIRYMDLDDTNDILEIWFVFNDEWHSRQCYTISRLVIEQPREEDDEEDYNDLNPFNKIMDILKDTIKNVSAKRKKESEEYEYKNYLKLKAKFEGKLNE